MLSIEVIQNFLTYHIVNGDGTSKVGKRSTVSKVTNFIPAMNIINNFNQKMSIKHLIYSQLFNLIKKKSVTLHFN